MLFFAFIAAALLVGQPMLAACQDHQEQTTIIYFHMPRRQELEKRMLDIAESHGNWLTLEELSEYTRVNKTVKDQAEAAFRGHELKWNGRGNILRINGSHTVPQHMDRHVLWTSVSDKKAATTAASWPDLRTKHRQVIPQRARPTAANDNATCQEGIMTPPCLRQLYNFADYQGKADDPSIGILAVTHPHITRGFRQSDLDAYMKLYRPDIPQGSYKPRVIETNGGQYSEDSGSPESCLDTLTTASLVAPIPLQFLVVGQDDPTTDIFKITFDYLTDDSSRPSVFLMAYGLTERFIKDANAAMAMCELAVQLTALGTTLVVASGDNGVNGAIPPGSSSGCPPFTPSYPSGCPWILSVGGLYGLKPEHVVSAVGQGYWSGGGFSLYFPRPTWQEPAVSDYIKNHTAVPHTNFNEKGRGFPDVAAQGGPYDIILNGVHADGDGTSASVNTVAAMIGLLNSARKRVGKGTVGWVHPLLYKNASSIFRDVTEGGIYGCGKGANATDPKLGFTADKGWDPASGLGAIDFEKMRRVFGA